MATDSPLGQLIHSARAPERLSLQDIADRASRRGVPMSKQNVSRLANEYPLGSISGENVRGLALALGISERRVAAAALAAMGVELGESTTPVRQAILDAEELGQRTKRVLLSIIDAEVDELELEESLPGGAARFRLGNVDDTASHQEAARKIRPPSRDEKNVRDKAGEGSQDTGGMDPL